MRRPYTFAAWSLILLLIINVFGTLLSLILFGSSLLAEKVIGLIISLINLPLIIYYMLGFIAIGKHYNAKLLKVMALIGLVVGIIFGISSILLNGSIMFIPPATSGFAIEGENNSLAGDFSDAQIASAVTAIFGLVMVVLFIFVLVISGIIVYVILFGVGLTKVGDRIKYAKGAGILNIVAGATLIIFVGFIVLFAARIIEILMFFELAKTERLRKL